MAACRPRQALASAVLKVAEAYTGTPTAVRPDVGGPRWRQFEAEVDDAVGRGDQDLALTAIERWRDHALAELARGRGPASNTTLPGYSRNANEGP